MNTHPQDAVGRAEEYRSVFESVNDGLLIYALDGRQVDFNPAACRLWGYTVDEFRRLPSDALVHGASLPAFRGLFARVQAAGEFRGRGTMVRKDGSTFVADVRVTAFLYDGQPHALAIIRDVSDEVAALHLLEQRVAERTRELTTILQSSRQIGLTLDLEAVLDLILEQLQTVVPYSGASIMSLEDDRLVGRAYRGPKPKGWINQFRFPIDNPIDCKVISSRQPFIAEDLHGDNPVGRYFQADHGERFATLYAGVRSWMRIPLIARDEVIGMLTLHHGDPQHFSARDADLALAFADQAAVAIHNARLYAQARQLASIQERQRLARELHDSVSQALYGIALGAHTARSLLDMDPPRAAAPLDYVVQLAEAAMAEMRALIFELRPESLEQEGLVAALQKQADALAARHQLAVAVDLCAEPDLALECKEALLRVAQEALHNVVKHAHATRVELRLYTAAGALQLLIRDNGRGFDPSGDFPGHLGLRSMRERIEDLRGDVAVASTPGAGTCVSVQLPAA